MNLFFNQSLREFYKMIVEAGNTRPIHDVVLDYDGEILIDPQINQPGLDLNKFKFRVRLNEITRMPITFLFNCFLDAWNSETLGLLQSGSQKCF